MKPSFEITPEIRRRPGRPSKAVLAQREDQRQAEQERLVELQRQAQQQRQVEQQRQAEQQRQEQQDLLDSPASPGFFNIKY